MINICLRISNPWYRGKFSNLWNKTWLVTKNKAFEIEVLKYGFDVIEFNLNLTHRQDHAGFDLTFGLLGYTLHLNLYDTRHWDHENRCWEKYND